MDTILIICTVLGGIAAIGYILEKTPLNVWSRFRYRSQIAAAIPAEPTSIGAYIQAHPRPKKLDSEIAEDTGLTVIAAPGDWKSMHEMTSGLSIKTIKDLDRIVHKHFLKARRLSHYMRPETGVPTGFGVTLALEIEAMHRGGLEGLNELLEPLKLTSSSQKFRNELWRIYSEFVCNPRDKSKYFLRRKTWLS